VAIRRAFFAGAFSTLSPVLSLPGWFPFQKIPIFSEFHYRGPVFTSKFVRLLQSSDEQSSAQVAFIQPTMKYPSNILAHFSSGALERQTILSSSLRLPI